MTTTVTKNPNVNMYLKKFFTFILYISLFLIMSSGLAAILEKLYLDNIANLCSSRYLFLGSSHIRSGIDELYMSEMLGEPVAKFGLPSAGTRLKKIILEYYLSEKGTPDILFYEIGGLMFNDHRFSANAYKQLYPLIDNDLINRFVQSNDSLKDYYLVKSFKLLRFNGDPVVRAFRSALGVRKDNFLRDNIVNASDVDIFRKKLQRDFKEKKQHVEPEILKVFESTLDLAKKRGIKVVLLYLPEYYAIDEYFDYSEVYSEIREIANHYGAEVVDFNNDFKNDNRWFRDIDHLNARGQMEFSKKMVTYIRESGSTLIRRLPQKQAN